MLTKTNELLQGEIISKEIIDSIFNKLEDQILDRSSICLDLKKITFISVYFLERLEKLVQRAKDLSVQIQITNVPPAIYKVFQVGRTIDILNACS